MEHPITNTLLIQILYLFAIVILVIATILRPYYFPLHLVEIGFFILIILKLSIDKSIENPLIRLFWAQILLSFAVVWIISVIFILDRFSIELHRDLFYWLLIVFFLIIKILFIIISFKVIYDVKAFQMTSIGIEASLMIWISMITFIGCIFFILAPKSDIQDFFSHKKNLISITLPF